LRIAVNSLLLALLGLGSGCAGFGYTGKSSELSRDALIKERGWVAVHGVPLYRQQAHHDCGPTALAMVLRYWNPDTDVQPLLSRPVDAQSSAADLRGMARERGYSAFVVEGKVEDLVHEIKLGRPVIVGVAKPTALGPIAHYEVLVGMHPGTQRVATLDPARGFRQNSYRAFLEEWVATGSVLIVIMPRDVAPTSRSPHVASDPTQASRLENDPAAALHRFSSVSGASPR
jgi:ABC-type bacteriocin/lantibiotic exporter with double-glycine peptidase domain